MEASLSTNRWSENPGAGHIYFMHYNYVRIHQTLRVTPAMVAGVTKVLWGMDDIVKVVEDWEEGEVNGPSSTTNFKAMD